MLTNEQEQILGIGATHHGSINCVINDLHKHIKTVRRQCELIQVVSEQIDATTFYQDPVIVDNVCRRIQPLVGMYADNVARGYRKYIGDLEYEMKRRAAGATPRRLDDIAEWMIANQAVSPLGVMLVTAPIARKNVHMLNMIKDTVLEKVQGISRTLERQLVTLVTEQQGLCFVHIRDAAGVDSPTRIDSGVCFGFRLLSIDDHTLEQVTAADKIARAGMHRAKPVIIR